MQGNRRDGNYLAVEVLEQGSRRQDWNSCCEEHECGHVLNKKLRLEAAAAVG